MSVLEKSKDNTLENKKYHKNQLCNKLILIEFLGRTEKLLEI